MAGLSERRRLAAERVSVWAVCAVWIVPGLLLATLAYAVQTHFHIDVPPPLSEDSRTQAMMSVRRALDEGVVVRPEHPALERSLDDDGPVTVTLWYRGSHVLRTTGRGPRIADALVNAVENMLEIPRVKRLRPAMRKQIRIKIDIAVGRGPLSEAHALARSLSLHPGLEGLGVRFAFDGAPDATTGDDEVEMLLLPDELIQHRFLTRSKPLSFVPDFTIGLDVARAVNQ